MRTILHSDLNCFYASVEVNENPKLRDQAIAVCGSTEERHGIVGVVSSSIMVSHKFLQSGLFLRGKLSFSLLKRYPLHHSLDKEKE